jgi:hypothetical protein
MSKASGLFLILGGLAVAMYVMPSDDDASVLGAAAGTDVAKTSQADEPRSFDVTAIRPQPAFRTVAPAPTRTAEAVAVPAFSAPVVVTITQRPSEPPAAMLRAAPIPRDRDTLTRELQKELRRVGCYEGELNGAWTPATRRAMKAFTDRVNATLPVEEPDAILFAMVQGHQDKACGKPCPSGQGLSDEGRCLPNAILAKAVKKGPPATVAQLPKSIPAPAAMLAPATTGWSTVTTTAAPAPTPVLASTPAPAPVVASAPPLGPPPTEGRMALAGPTEPPPPALALAAPTVPPPAPAARRASPAPRATVQQNSQGNSWARSMQARRFDGLN